MKILFIIYDNSSFLTYFPIGIAYLASVLRKNNREVYIYNQDVHHYPEEHLTHYLDKNNFDIVGIGTVAGYYPYHKLLKISKAVNKSINRNNFKYIIGGHMVTAEPEYFLKKTDADVIIRGEGEVAILDAIKKDSFPIIEKPQIDNLDNLPLPAYDLFPITYYRLQRLPNIETTEFSMSIISGRGCHQKCNFCQKIFQGIRLRSIESIVDEIKFLKINYNISYIDFADDLTMSSKQRAVELSEALIPLKIKWRCEGRLNYVDEEVLDIMKKSGCVFINYGIESLDNEVLKNMRKNLTVSQIIKGVETTLKVGISPGLNIIWGNLGDNIETLGKGVDFLLKYDDGAQLRTIRPVTPYPGTELYKEAIKRGLLKDVEDFYEKKHLNSDLFTVNFMDISNEDAYKALYMANEELLYNYYNKKRVSNIKILDTLYTQKNTDFRGFRQT